MSEYNVLPKINSVPVGLSLAQPLQTGRLEMAIFEPGGLVQHRGLTDTAHRLRIEPGRHSKLKVNEEVSQNCQLNHVEDDVHFPHSCFDLLLSSLRK
jgi:hypothetical protein